MKSRQLSTVYKLTYTVCKFATNSPLQASILLMFVFLGFPHESWGFLHPKHNKTGKKHCITSVQLRSLHYFLNYNFSQTKSKPIETPGRGWTLLVKFCPRTQCNDPACFEPRPTVNTFLDEVCFRQLPGQKQTHTEYYL